MISLTYAVFALSLAYILDKRLVTAVIFALVPSFDFLLNHTYPFTYHGIMHSIFAASVFTLLVYTYTEDRVSAESCFLGYSSHLFLDILTYSSIPLLFPLGHQFSLSLVSAYSLEANSAIITVSIAAMYIKKNREYLEPVLP